MKCLVAYFACLPFNQPSAILSQLPDKDKRYSIRLPRSPPPPSPPPPLHHHHRRHDHYQHQGFFFFCKRVLDGTSSFVT